MSQLKESANDVEELVNWQTALQGDKQDFLVILTRGISVTVPPEVVLQLVTIAKQKLTGSVSWVVFCPLVKKWSFEDEGRTCRFPLQLVTKEIKDTIYAILDDYGSVEALRKSSGNPFISTKCVLTLLFSHEY